jgi:hypothetical protein
VSTYLEAIGRLREDLVQANYFVDPVLEAISDQGQLGLERNHTVAATRALAGREDGLATLIRLFVLQQSQDSEVVNTVLKANELVDLGILACEGNQYKALVDIRPYADETDGTSGWVVSDHTATLDTKQGRTASNHVLGISPASVSLAGITPRRPVGHALDLGTGCGIQSLHLARQADHVTATDLNPRALTLATLTFALNELEVTTRLGSLYDPVHQESFDLITTNPPFVISPTIGPRLTYRETDYPCDDLMKTVVQGASPRLNTNGTLHVIGNWAHIEGRSWQERITEWIPQGCDAFIVQREVLDIYEYIEIWLADAGLRGQLTYLENYEQWLNYFDELKIEAVGMGWITMIKSGSPTPRVICEHWPHPSGTNLADDLMAHLTVMDYQSWSQEKILEKPWVLAPGTVQETIGNPGEEDPTHIILRRRDGLYRATQVSTALGAILGACDGDLGLGQIIHAVASILDTDPARMITEVLPEITSLISQTWLKPGVEDSQPL